MNAALIACYFDLRVWCSSEIGGGTFADFSEAFRSDNWAADGMDDGTILFSTFLRLCLHSATSLRNILFALYMRPYINALRSDARNSIPIAILLSLKR